MGVEVEFQGEEAQRFYRLTNAPNVEEVGSKRVTIVPTVLEIHVSDGLIRMVTVGGIVERRDGKDGTWKRQGWTQYEWADMPDWLAKIVASTGIPLMEVGR